MAEKVDTKEKTVMELGDLEDLVLFWNTVFEMLYVTLAVIDNRLITMEGKYLEEMLNYRERVAQCQGEALAKWRTLNNVFEDDTEH